MYPVPTYLVILKYVPPLASRDVASQVAQTENLLMILAKSQDELLVSVGAYNAPSQASPLTKIVVSAGTSTDPPVDSAIESLLSAAFKAINSGEK